MEFNFVMIKLHKRIGLRTVARAMAFVFKCIILHNSLCLLCGGGWIKSVLLLCSTNHQVCLNPLLSFLSLKLSLIYFGISAEPSYGFKIFIIWE